MRLTSSDCHAIDGAAIRLPGLCENARASIASLKPGSSMGVRPCAASQTIAKNSDALPGSVTTKSVSQPQEHSARSSPDHSHVIGGQSHEALSPPVYMAQQVRGDHDMAGSLEFMMDFSADSRVLRRTRPRRFPETMSVP